MLTFPNAKINIGLFVTEKRADGFHNIETILFPIPLCDALEITENTGISNDFDLRVHGLSIDGNPKDNLIYKAYALLKNDFSLPKMRVDLLKKIPFGAGLGGGSADATFMLKALNEKFSLHLSDEKLEAYARQIGSDCACFVKNKPVFAYEKGDVFEPVELDLWMVQLVLICPPIHVNTKSAYQNLTPQKSTFDLRTLPHFPIEMWKNVIRNDFETSVFSQHPELSDIKQKLYDLGADYAAMSGSGSSIFGLFPYGTIKETQDPTSSQDICDFLKTKFKNCSVFCLNL